MEENSDIIEEYFDARKDCQTLDCAKVIFEPNEKREWFFDDGSWCYFQFDCEDKDYWLFSSVDKDFDETCYLKNMSYEIKMLIGFSRLRNILVIEKDVFDRYVLDFEEERKYNSSLTIEKYNYDKKIREEDALTKANKTANKILAGCLGAIIIAIIAFLVVIFSIFFTPKAYAESKYTETFKQNFIQCRNFSESKYNVAYNSQAKYEIMGYLPDGSERCKYVETNQWLRGKNTTTCLFSPKQMQEYYTAMLTPDIKHSVQIGAMPVVGAHEEVVFLKYFNDPKVCTTVGSFY